ncbi:hypothetical protein GF402_03090 [Candidatus Fermentibacteria bacterium]|nr:hypothetical protein [Candidatus Fermentibacteria bacterium]
MLSGEIIAAWATPPGVSALAVVRLSGDGCVRLAEALLGLEDGRLSGGMRRARGEVRRQNHTVDEVVAFSWPEGRSYTGEEMVEITCHGVPGRVREVLKMTFDLGARQAEPGEFTRRAFLNGRMGALDVIALSEMTRTGSTGVGESKIGELCRCLEESLARTMELLEGNVEFCEAHGLRPEEDRLRDQCSELLRRGRKLREAAYGAEKPRRVHFLGPRNAGKSTLVNALAGKELALTSPEPGTTRDGVSVVVEMDGRGLELRDSAGVSGRGLEAEAFGRALRSVEDGDLVVWMSEGPEPGPPPELQQRAGRIVRVVSKADLHRVSAGGMRVSSLTGEGMEELRRTLSEAGETPLGACSDRMVGRLETAMRILQKGDYALTAEILADVKRMLSGLMNGSVEGMGKAVERALDGLCVGK